MHAIVSSEQGDVERALLIVYPTEPDPSTERFHPVPALRRPHWLVGGANHPLAAQRRRTGVESVACERAGSSDSVNVFQWERDRSLEPYSAAEAFRPRAVVAGYWTLSRGVRIAPSVREAASVRPGAIR